MFKDSKIYVAGHTGLLGSSLMKKLKEQGFLNIIVRTHAELDLTDSTAVDELFKCEQPEYVFMAAGLTGGILANKTYPAEFLHTNISIQDNVFQAAQEYAVKHLIFYGSSCVYPKHCPQPIKEEYLLTGEIEETSEAYAIAKTAGIIACRAYNSQYKTNRFIALVPNSMYGPNDNFDPENSHVLSALIRRFHIAHMLEINNWDEIRKDLDKDSIDGVNGSSTEEDILSVLNEYGITDHGSHITVSPWGTGNPRREFIFGEDVADASVFAMLNADKLENRHYNIGTGIDYSIKEIAELIADVVDFEGEILWDTSNPDGAMRKLLDSSRFMNLGWKSTVLLEDGLRRTYRWYLKNCHE